MFKQALQANRDSTVSMLELAEIYYLQHKIPASTEMYEQYVRTVGQKNQSARALWVGIRVARANADRTGVQVLVNQLRIFTQIVQNINVICNYSTVLRPYGNKS